MLSRFAAAVLQAIEQQEQPLLPREIAALANAEKWNAPRSRGALTTNVIRCCESRLAKYVCIVTDERGQRTLARDPNRYPLFKEVAQ